MKKNKKYYLITTLSASVLLGLSLSFSNTVHADTTNNAQTVDQNDATADQNNQNTDMNDETDTTSSTSSTKLNDQAAEHVKNAGIDESSLTQDQVQQINKIHFSRVNQNTGTQFTYHQYRSLAHKMINRDPRYQVPYFNPKKIVNMPATHTKDAQTGKTADLDIWDSWVVQDENTGEVVNYKGYQLAIAMMGIPNKNDSHIYLLYNKYGDNDFSHWKTAGPIFGFGATSQNQEWSGSATLNSDGTIQLFYTDVDTSQGDNNQKISTANLQLNISSSGKVSIAKVSNRHVLFTGDGYHYQTYDQWKATNKGADNIAMRDAHVIAENGKRYLVFEASTGTENYQNENQIYDWQNYGGSDKNNIDEFLGIVGNSDMTSRASWANAAIGIISLDDDEDNPSVDDVYTPLISAPMVTDEIERPDVIKLNGKYYLFTTTRLNRGTGDDLWLQANKEIGDNVAMLGWVSDHLTYGYKPLNGDATVLTASVPFNWRTSTYSYYAVPIPGRDDEVLITSYMTNRGYAAGAGKRSTWAPSFIVKINSDNTTEVTDQVTEQGVWTYNEDSLNPDMAASSLNAARLKGEPDPDPSGALKKIKITKKTTKKSTKKSKKTSKSKKSKKTKKSKKSKKKTSKKKSKKKTTKKKSKKTTKKRSKKRK